VSIVVHSSKHGASQRYAEWIGEALGAPVAASSDVEPDDLRSHDLAVFCAPMYGPILRDSGVLAEAMRGGDSTRWVLVTVGLSDPALTTKRDELVASKFDAVLRERLLVFHVRGAMDRKRLTLVERSLMGVLRKSLRAKRDRTAEEQAMLDVLEPDTIDLTDRAAVAPIVEACLR
jgi:hypothetical protein